MPDIDDPRRRAADELARLLFTAEGRGTLRLLEEVGLFGSAGTETALTGRVPPELEGRIAALEPKQSLLHLFESLFSENPRPRGGSMHPK